MAFDLFIRNNVVLVDDRHDAGAHEMVERLLDVLALSALFEIVVRKQDLTDLNASVAEELFVFAYKTGLAYGRTHLNIVRVGRSGRKSQRLDAGCYSSRGDENHLIAGLSQSADSVDDAFQSDTIGTTRFIGDCVSSYLNYHARRIFLFCHIPKLYHKMGVLCYFYRQTGIKRRSTLVPSFGSLSYLKKRQRKEVFVYPFVFES